MDDSGGGSNSRLAWAVIGVPIVVVLGIAFYVIQPLIFPEPLVDPSAETAGTLQEARVALQRRNYPLAGALAYQTLLKDPRAAEAALIAGEAALRLGDSQAALTYYRAVPKEDGPRYLKSLWAAGGVYLSLGKLREAEKSLRAALAIDPHNRIANERLAFVLGVEGRRWESIPYLLEPIRQGHIAMEPLLLLATIHTKSAHDPQIIAMSRKVNPDDWVPLIGTARIGYTKRDYAETEKLLHGILQHAPEQVEAHALLGLTVAAEDDAEKFHRWTAHLPKAAEKHPDVWFARGIWAQKHDDLKGAARCFWEAIRISPNHPRANYRLSQTLAALGKNDEAQPFLQRAQRIEELGHLLDTLYALRESDPDVAQIMRAGEISDLLGRQWEAWAWFHLARTIDPKNTKANEEASRLTAKVSANPPLVVLSARPTHMVDLSSWPLPKWTTSASPPAETGKRQYVVPRFVNVAPAADLHFAYNNGDDLEIEGLLLTQQLGGGLVILDYDLDGWPDIYMSQGGPWPRDPQQTEYYDRLFRNLGNGKFQDVTRHANLGDRLYSQGATAGDFDGDGLPDLFVCNLGANRFYHNQGDGTFREITSDAGIAGDRWSTSCVLADLNGDRWPDLYVANYVGGPDAMKTDSTSHPLNFPAEQDRLYLSHGDGRFEDVTDGSGVVAPDGRGLGVVAADLHGSGRLNLYVSNDGTANFYFVNETAQPGGTVRLVENSLAAGLAFDREGASQASMGIAAGDGNGDGLLDLFVTHFYQESNTYYRQETGGYFADASEEMGLRQPSLPSLAFGTQFLDYDADGYLDLVIACGHVGEYRDTGDPFQMPPQAYYNNRNGGFLQVPNSSIGDYFDGQYLGRSLATLDWDRDGRLDFAVMHLYEPVALLANQTPQTGHYLQLRLRGTRCARDGIGTTVRAMVGERVLVRQLIGGNGFQCRCEPVLHFGLGGASAIDQLEIHWPGGDVQKFQSVRADRDVILIEGTDQLIESPRDEIDTPGSGE